MLPLDVDGLVSDFDLAETLGPLVVERRVAPTYNATSGGMTRATATLLNIRPWSAHTVGGRQIMDLPEAVRNKEATAFYVQNVQLYVADDSHEADVIRYDSRRWVVATVNRYAAQGRVWFAMATLCDVQGDA
jgi:hypothetical protein